MASLQVPCNLYLKSAAESCMESSAPEPPAQQESGLQKRKSSGGVRFSGAGAGAEPRRQRQSHIGGDPYSGSTFAGSFSRRRRPSHIEEELTESRRGSVFGSRRASLEDEAETDSASAAPTVFASPWAAAHVRCGIVIRDSCIEHQH
eukprot:scaffold42679_cov18-Tisochrysis_lutea.AAC.1